MARELDTPPIDEVDLDAVLHALADPHRRRVVVELAGAPDEERSCASFGLPLAKSTRTYHWRVLREAGLIDQRDRGNGTFLRLRRKELDGRFPGLLETLTRLSSRGR